MRALLRSACCLQLAFSQISQARLSKTDKDPEQHRTTRPQTTSIGVARGTVGANQRQRGAGLLSLWLDGDAGRMRGAIGTVCTCPHTHSSLSTPMKPRETKSGSCAGRVGIFDFRFCGRANVVVTTFSCYFFKALAAAF